MTGAAGWLLVALGLGVVVVRRRSVAVGLVTVQALVVALIALIDSASTSETVAGLTLAVRAVALGVLFLLAVSRSREAQPVRARVPPTVRVGIAVVLMLVLTELVPAYGLTSRSAERSVLALVAAGLVCAATRRATLFQVLGIVVVDDGLALAAVTSPHASSLVIELGVTLDLTLIVCVAALFHLRIFTEFGAGDSAALRRLRD